jgi:hypothetical protein
VNIKIELTPKEAEILKLIPRFMEPDDKDRKHLKSVVRKIEKAQVSK